MIIREHFLGPLAVGYYHLLHDFWIRIPFKQQIQAKTFILVFHYLIQRALLRAAVDVVRVHRHILRVGHHVARDSENVAGVALEGLGFEGVEGCQVKFVAVVPYEATFALETADFSLSCAVLSLEFIIHFHGVALILVIELFIAAIEVTDLLFIQLYLLLGEYPILFVFLVIF